MTPIGAIIAFLALLMLAYICLAVHTLGNIAVTLLLLEPEQRQFYLANLRRKIGSAAIGRAMTR